MASTTTLVTDSVTDLNNSKDAKKKEKLFKDMNIKEKIVYLKELITIEPLLCCYVVGQVLCGPPITNLQLEMACRGDSGFNDTTCEAVVTATHAEKNLTKENSMVQQHVSDMLSWTIPVQSIIPVILLLFFGSYSDRHKIRKPFLLLPVVGEIVAILCCLVCKAFMDTWSVSAIGISATLSSIFGGASMITMAAFAYIADVSTQDMRIVRMAVIQICLSVCVPVALTFSGVLFDAIGYVPTLLLSLLIYVLGFLDGLFLVKEPKYSNEPKKLKDLLRDVVNPQHAMETLKLLTHAKGAQRINIIFILVVVYISATVIGGEEYVLFYFAQHAYGWDYSHFTIYLAVWTVINSIGLAVGALLLSKVLHLHDLIIVAISFLGKIMANVIFITVKSTWGLYIGLLAGILQDAGFAGIRSQSTKYVSDDDIGKSQSLLSIVEAIAFAVAAEIYHQGIYTYTRDTYIQAFFYVGIVLFAFGTVIVMWKYFSEKHQLTKEEAVSQNGTELKKQKSDVSVF